MNDNLNPNWPPRQVTSVEKTAALTNDWANKPITPYWEAKSYKLPAAAPMPDETPYPVHALPLNMREPAVEAHEQDGIPIATAASFIIGTAGFITQDMANIQISENELIGLALLWLIVTSSRDERNMLTHRFASALEEIDAAEAESHKVATNAFKAALRLWKVDGNALDGKLARLLRDGESTEAMLPELEEHERNKPVKPRSPRFLFDDIDGGEFIDALEGDGHSAAVLADESSKLMKSTLFRKILAINNAPNGCAVPLKRGRDESVVARNARVSVMLTIPQSLRDAYLSDHDSVAFGKDNLAQFLFVDAKAAPNYRVTSNEGSARIAANVFKELCNALKAKCKQMIASGTSQRPVIKLDKDATELLRAYQTRVAELVQSGAALADIADIARQAPKLACMMAGTFHCFSEQNGDLTRDSLDRAITIVTWHLAQFKRRFGELPTAPQVVQDAGELDSWMTRKYFANGWLTIEKKWVRRDVTPTYLRDDARINAALDFLVAEKRIRLTPGPRRQCVIQVHIGF